MKFFFTILLSISFIATEAQVLNLEKLENAVQNASNGTYRDVFSQSGFELVESTKEGEKGIYEKWIRKDNNLFLTIQHNDSFHFTKLILSTATDSSKPTVRNLLDEVSRNYSRKSLNDKDYFIKESSPETTVHEITLKKDDQVVEGVLFFRKYGI